MTYVTGILLAVTPEVHKKISIIHECHYSGSDTSMRSKQVSHKNILRIYGLDHATL